MDLGTASLFDLPAPTAEVDAAAPAPATATRSRSRSDELLVALRDNRVALTDCQINEVRHIAVWATEHVVSEESGDAATITERGFDTGLPVAGEGAPLISDFAVMELTALLGRSLDSGRAYVGQVVELAHRLPKLWARVLDGEVPVWKALRIAATTHSLPCDAAGYVDRHIAAFAHSCTWAQIDRLVEEALVRFDPETAEEKRQAALEQRHVRIGLDEAGFDGIAHLDATLDIADALDLENAIARRAKLLGQLGDDDTLDVRRSRALGEIARDDLTLDLEVADPDTGEITRTIPGRKTELMLHLNADTLTGAGLTGPGLADTAVGRLGNTRTPVSVQQIKTWLANPGTSVIVRPVIDLNGHQPVDSYEIPDRIRTQVTTRDHHCVYPYCTKPAERCDLDHVIPHSRGGPTCPCNLACECRGHHRYKTSGLATCRVLKPGTYLWTLPSGQYLVDATGTYPLNPGQPPPDARPPDAADPPDRFDPPDASDPPDRFDPPAPPGATSPPDA